ncbi:Uncharacterized protein APZ42_026008 [Daphnia magna]|uniref:Uncharacterized protein n=1 Tax=Daphnia magna TaxID=35525 RepID=A0A164SJJ0_9CRUS|nr:Uncharacterized protein APZ42_026008 [Daphnia magna]
MSSVELVDGLDGLKSFLALHYAQLKSSGIPEIYWATLHSKLTDSNFDAGDSFSIAEINDDITLMNSTFNRWKVMVTRPGGYISH